MAVFGQGYYSAMDDQYQGMGLSPKDIGISTPPMKDQLEGLKARIFQGASRVELGFTGVGKGSMQGQTPTPGSYGEEEREAIRDLAKVNRVELTTHATVGIGGLAGFTQQGFREEARENSLKEIERAIDFAADTTQGGPVVVHTGEFPRPMSEKYEGFLEYKEEPKKALMLLVDKVTGDIVKTVRKDQTVFLPEWQKDKQGNYILDNEGRKIPVSDPETKEIKLKEYKFNDFEDMAKKTGEKPEHEFFMATLESEEEQARSWARYHERMSVDRPLKLKKELKERFEEIQKLPEGFGKNMAIDRFRQDFKINATETDYNSMINEVDKEIEEGRRDALGYREKIKELEKVKKNTKPVEDYAIDKSADTMARAGEYALELTKSKHLPNPLFVAPENIFPEQYGAHPQELKELILRGREKMAKDLEVAYGSEEAKRLADEHIKATFDIGHAYIWRKYFKKKEGETIEQADKRFNRWLAKEVKDLTDEGIIGHVHVSDNFGWADEHVTPGHGRVPIKDFVEQIKKAGIKNVIVEPAHQDYKAMLGGWKEFGSSIYGITTPGVRRDTWTNVEHSYFGRTAPPMYVVGPFAPSKDWTLWSQTPLE